jgi:HEAT repeat protein
MAETDPFSEKRNDPRSIEELVKTALDEPDDDLAWKAVTVLHFKGNEEVLAKAQGLCGSRVAEERALGADILGQLGVPDRTFPEECFQTLRTMLNGESDPDVLQSIAIAFGHLNDVRAVPLLAPLRTHLDAEVRLGVVRGLSRHEDAQAIESLIVLSRDEDEDVRDWATFGLGTMIATDSPEIRDALVARLSDGNDDARGEALVGLARRKDDRVFEALYNELGAENVGLLALEAAEEFADPRLVPALLELQETWKDDNDRWTGDLQQALLRCQQPGATQNN